MSTLQKLLIFTPRAGRQPFAKISTRVRRAVLYVPGDDDRKLRKATKLDVDCVILDCEDGVATNKKEAARRTISNFLSTQKLNYTRTDYSVRLNSVESGLMSDDIRVICGAKKAPETLFIPKTNTLEEICYFSEYLKKFLFDKKIKINVFVYAESCIAIMDLPSICRRAIELSNISPFRLAGIVFGSDDFCASLGASRTETSQEILYARQRVVLVAKAFNLQAIDMVYIDLKDDEGLQKQSVEGVALGYTGKQVIHPKQISVVQEAYVPPEVKVKWARDLLDAYKSYQKSGKGAFNFRGKMMDAPTVKQAENILFTLRATKKAN